MPTYYVGPGGNNGNPGTAVGSPWASIAYAMGASSPVVGGDTIYVRSGTPYTGYVVVGRAGTPGNPITIDTYPADLPVKAQITTGGVLGGIYCAISSNWTIKNLEICNTVGGAGVYFDDAPGLGVNDVWTIDSCHIHHNNSGDNASGIYIQRQRGTILIQNNVIHDNLINPPNATSGYNATAVVTFGWINPGHPGNCTVRILHNEIYNQAVGVKFKHPYATDNVVTVEVAYNYLHHITGRASIESNIGNDVQGSATQTKRIHHNLICNSPNGPGIKPGVDYGEWDLTIDHNTVYNCENGVAMHREDTSQHANRNTVYDNIFVPKQIAGGPPAGAGVWLEEWGTPYNTFDYNHYWNLSNTVVSVSLVNNTYQSLGVWRTSTNNPDAHATQSNPLFVNVASDWHLQAGSPCRNSDRLGNDKGCYELRNEQMGPLAGSAPDVTAPVVSGGLPTGLLAAGTTSINLQVTTNEVATVKYGTVAGVAYASQPSTFSSTGGTAHSTLVTGLTNGSSYTYYVRAIDMAGNPTGSDYVISFSVASSGAAGLVGLLDAATGSGVLGAVSGAGARTFTKTISPGSNRCLIVGVAKYGAATIGAATYGGQTMTPAAAQATVAGPSHVRMFSLLEAGIAAATSNVISVSFNDDTDQVVISAIVYSSVAAANLPHSVSAQTTSPLTLSPTAPTSKDGVVGIAGCTNAAMAKSVGVETYRIAGQTVTSLVHNLNQAFASVAWTFPAGGDSAGGVAILLTASAAPDTTAPVLSSPAPSGTLPSNTTSTTLTVTTDENATVKYGPLPGQSYASQPTTFTTTGGTAHSTTVSGLTSGQTYTYYVRAQDPSGNASASDLVITFQVAVAADVTPPVLSGLQPTGALPAGTTSATLQVTTNEAATVKYSTTAGQTYAAMPTPFTTTGGTAHGTVVSGLVNGGSYTYYVRALDGAGNANTSDAVITFTVAQPADVSEAILTNPLPTGTLAAGTTSTNLQVTSNEAATVKYSTTAGQAYDAMPGTFATTGGTSHTTPIAGLQNGQSYTYYVKSRDVAGNTNSNDVVITFQVALPADVTAPVMSAPQPAGTLDPFTNATLIGLTTNENATCKYGPTPGVAYAAQPNDFQMTGGLTHRSAVAGLANGQTYTYYARCQDTAGNPTVIDQVITFAIADTPIAGAGAGPIQLLGEDMLRFNTVAPITPSDTTLFERLTQALYVGVTGNVSVLMGNNTTQVFVGVAAGSILPLAVKRVNAGGTTATNLLALYTT